MVDNSASDVKIFDQSVFIEEPRLKGLGEFDFLKLFSSEKKLRRQIESSPSRPTLFCARESRFLRDASRSWFNERLNETRFLC